MIGMLRRGLAGLLLLLAPAAAAEFDLQGHRGARGLAPENTLAGFATALGIGVTTLEMDLGITADDVVVLVHDRRLNPDIVRGPDGRWLDGSGPPIRALTLDELRRYDVGRLRPGSRYATRFPDQRPADGERIPTLAEVVALTRKADNDAVRFNIETKLSPHEPEITPGPRAFAEAVLATVRSQGIEGRTTVQSFDWRSLRAVQQMAPAIPTVCLTVERSWLDNLERGRPGPSPWTAGLDLDDFDGDVPALVQAAGCAVWSPYFRDLTPDDLAVAQELGLKVVVWTVNELADMAALIELGVDGIITDHPDRLRKVMAEQGLPLPAATPVEP